MTERFGVLVEELNDSNSLDELGAEGSIILKLVVNTRSPLLTCPLSGKGYGSRNQIYF